MRRGTTPWNDGRTIALLVAGLLVAALPAAAGQASTQGTEGAPCPLVLAGGLEVPPDANGSGDVVPTDASKAPGCADDGDADIRKLVNAGGDADTDGDGGDARVHVDGSYEHVEVRAPWKHGSASSGGCYNSQPNEDTGHMETAASGNCFAVDQVWDDVPDLQGGSYWITYRFHADRLYANDGGCNNNDAKVWVVAWVYDHTDDHFEDVSYLFSGDSYTNTGGTVYETTNEHLHGSHAYSTGYQIGASTSYSCGSLVAPNAHAEGQTGGTSFEG